MFKIISLFLLTTVFADDTITATATADAVTNTDDSTTSTSSSSSVSPTMIWVTGTLSGALATYQTVWSQTFLSTFTSASIPESGAASTSSYDLSSALSSKSSVEKTATSENDGNRLKGAAVGGMLAGALVLL